MAHPPPTRVAVQEHRLLEILALLPVLHLRKGDDVVVAAAGKLAPIMADEAKRWPDIRRILVVGAPASKISDKRISHATLLQPATVDLLLLSPDEDPRPLIPALKNGGVINLTTYDPALWGPLTRRVKADLGSATPYREHLPLPLYGVLGRLGTAPTRLRQPPSSAKRLHRNYLPSLFTFGKDEIGLLNPPRSTP